MARPLRLEYPGALYHLTTHGNDERLIFLTDHDRNQFLQVLERIVRAHNWLCHAYCLMSNHYHLLVETLDANLSKGMRDLNGIYTQRFNRVHGHRGHIFQGRYKSFVIEKESYLLEVARYTVLNPVRAGIVTKPAQWRWSSYRATAGFCQAHRALSTNWILSYFSNEKSEAIRRYREFVKHGVGLASPFRNVVEGNILGSQQLVDYIWSLNPDVEKMMEVPRPERMIGRPRLQDLLMDSENQDQRDYMIAAAYYRCGYSQKEIADFIGVHYSTVCKILQNSRFKT